MSTLIFPSMAESQSVMVDPVEEEVQKLLATVAQATPDARAIFIARLIQGMAGKVNAAYSESVIKAAQSVSLTTKSSPNSGKGNAKVEPWPGAGRRELKDVFDPIEGWEHFGPEAYYRILYFEPVPILQMILAHPRMPLGKDPTKKASNTAIAKLIIDRLKKHFGVD